MGEENRKHRADSQEVLDLESIDVGVVGWFVIVKHQIDDIGRGANEEKLEGGEVQ